MLKVDRIGKKFTETPVLDNISFGYSTGVVGLAGHNGAGKSTLMALLSGLMFPSQGQVTLAGKAPEKHKNTIAYAPSHLSFGLNMPVVLYLAALLNTTQQQAKNVLQSWGVKSTGLARDLSFGNLQKLNLIQALHHPKAILTLLDEPMNGLDTLAQSRVREYIAQKSQTGLVFIASHQLEDLKLMCDDVLWLKSGCLHAKGKHFLDQAEELRLTFRCPHKLEHAIPADLNTWMLVIKKTQQNQVIREIVLQGGEFVDIVPLPLTLQAVYHMQAQA